MYARKLFIMVRLAFLETAKKREEKDIRLSK